jgi:hypothetical protein
VAERLTEFRALREQGVSERAAAKHLGIPRTTLQAWKASAETLDAEPSLIAFFESQPGLAVLHRIVVALHVVFVECCACGIRPVCHFLELTGLNRFVASSYTSQQKVNVATQNGIIGHAADERSRLAPAMPEKDISVTQDETFTGGLTLVAIEPESGFIILEEPSAARDAAAWKAAMDKATADLRCKIIQSTSDEGKGLVAYAENELGAHHSSDLFHVQYEASKGVSPPLAAKVRAAERAADEAQAKVNATEAEAEEYRQRIDERGPGRPPDWSARIDEAKLAAAEAQKEAERLRAVREGVRAEIKGIGADYHLADLGTGVRSSGDIMVEKLQGRIDRIRAAAEAEGLAEHSLARIAKAERVLPKMGQTVDFVSGYLRREVDKLGLTVAEALAVHSKLIPAFYLERIAARCSKKDGRPLSETAAALTSPLFAPGGIFAAMEAEAQDRLRREANRLAGVFQRSSSCVEGRNGVLSFRHHGLRGIPSRKRQCLTALHNYFIERKDGATAAQRFFGGKPRNLFHAVLNAVDVPRRPKSPPRRSTARPVPLN